MNNISLSYLFKLALKKLWFLLLAAAVFGVCTFCYCNFLTKPVYKAYGSLLVTNGALISNSTSSAYQSSSSKIAGTDIVASLNLADTIKDILNTPDIFKELSEATGGKYSYRTLMSSSTVARRSDTTLFIDISFSTVSRQDSVELVNTFLELAPKYIAKSLPDSNSSITTTADNAVKTYPRTAFSTLTAALIGAVVAFVIVFIVDSTDHALKGDKDFTENFSIPLLGTVPDFAETQMYSKGGYGNGSK